MDELSKLQEQLESELRDHWDERSNLTTEVGCDLTEGKCLDLAVKCNKIAKLEAEIVLYQEIICKIMAMRRGE
jgi:hypothetical protein